MTGVQTCALPILFVVPAVKRDRVLKKLLDDGYDEGPDPSVTFMLAEGDLLDVAYRGNVHCVDEDFAGRAIFTTNLDTLFPMRVIIHVLVIGICKCNVNVNVRVLVWREIHLLYRSSKRSSCAPSLMGVRSFNSHPHVVCPQGQSKTWNITSATNYLTLLLILLTSEGWKRESSYLPGSGVELNL